MKKIFYILFASSIVFSCGSDSDSDNDSTTLNQDLVGSWFGIITDSDGTDATAEQTLTFNSDGTCSVSNVWDDGETYFSNGTWSSTSSTITSTFSNGTETANYELSNNNTCIITRSDGVVIVYTRITLNEDLIGSWNGTTVDDSIPATSTEIELILNSDGEGEVLFDRTNLVTSETTFENWDITWASTSMTLTINYYDYDLPEGEQLYDTETHNYLFIDNDTLEITEDDGDVTIMYRN